MRSNKLIQRSYNKEEERILSSLLPKHEIDGKKILSFESTKVPIVLLRTNPNKVGYQRAAKELNQRAEIRHDAKKAIKTILEHEYGVKNTKDIKIRIDSKYLENEYSQADNGIRIAVSRNERTKASKGCKKVGMQTKIALSYEMQDKSAKSEIEKNKTLEWELHNKKVLEWNEEYPNQLKKVLTFNEWSSRQAQKKKPKKRKPKY